MSESKQITTVVSVKKAALVKRGIADFLEWKGRPNSLYIGRNMDFYVKGAVASKWGNPFSVKQYGVAECIKLYEEHIRKTPSLYDSLEELRGKELGCWCAPGPCHGDVLIRLLEE